MKKSNLLKATLYSMLSVSLAVISALYFQSSMGMVLTFFATVSAIIALAEAGIEVDPNLYIVFFAHLIFLIGYVGEKSINHPMNDQTYVWIGAGFALIVLFRGLFHLVIEARKIKSGANLLIIFSVFSILASCSNSKDSKDKAVEVTPQEPKIETHISECIFYNTEKKYSLEIKDESKGKSTSRTIIYDDVANNYLNPTRKLFCDSNNDGQIDSVEIYYYTWPENFGPNVRANCTSSEVLKKNQKTQSEYSDFLTIKDLLNNWVKEYQLGEHREETEKVFVDRFEDGYAVNNNDYLWIVKYKQDSRSVSGVDIVNP